MGRVVAIVEGDGEVIALPILLRRLAQEMGRFDIDVSTPIRVHRDQFLRRDEEFRRKILLAEAKAAGGTILVLLDADDDCPVLLAASVLARCEALISSSRLAVVIANREFEAWFIAAAESLAGRRGLAEDIASPINCDEIRNAKGWLSERIAQGRYHEVSDQPALTAVFDLTSAMNRSRSFRKLVDELRACLSEPDSGEKRGP